MSDAVDQVGAVVDEAFKEAIGISGKKWALVVVAFVAGAIGAVWLIRRPRSRAGDRSRHCRDDLTITSGLSRSARSSSAGRVMKRNPIRGVGGPSLLAGVTRSTASRPVSPRRSPAGSAPLAGRPGGTSPSLAATRRR